jgi:hypothetical protein
MLEAGGSGRIVSRVLFPSPSPCGPGSWDGHLSGMAVAGHLEQPTRGSRRLRFGWSVWVTPRRLFGLAPTGGCRAPSLALGAVGSYPTVSPLPREGLAAFEGGLFSVALSVASRRPGVTWQSTRWSSDFPRRHRSSPRPSHPTRSKDRPLGSPEPGSARFRTPAPSIDPSAC